MQSTVGLQVGMVVGAMVGPGVGAVVGLELVGLSVQPGWPQNTGHRRRSSKFKVPSPTHSDGGRTLQSTSSLHGTVGTALGATVGCPEGSAVGPWVGTGVGDGVGAKVGTGVGAEVGAGVGSDAVGGFVIHSHVWSGVEQSPSEQWCDGAQLHR